MTIPTPKQAADDHGHLVPVMGEEGGAGLGGALASKNQQGRLEVPRPGQACLGLGRAGRPTGRQGRVLGRAAAHLGQLAQLVGVEE